jgi:uncharacterized protein YjdB
LDRLPDVADRFQPAAERPSRRLRTFDEREIMSTTIRILGIAAVAVAGITCTDSSTGLRRAGLTGLALAPAFAQGAEGGPDIEISRVRGVLRNSTDSSVTEADVQGDSAVLEFADVPVTGDSTRYELQVQAFDENDVVVFEVEQLVAVRPGSNDPVEPILEYVAPDAEAASIDITGEPVALDWAGAVAGDLSCLNRAAKPTPVVTKQLAVAGLTAGGQPVSAVRVGWTSRDTTVATVDDNGLVRSRCSNKSTWIVARTFLDKADSVQVTVTAPPFSLLMTPDSTNVARGATVQLTAIVVDENGNTAPAAAVAWASSNTARATVSASGLVTGITNGRVLITASSSDRTTVGVVNVVRPAAAKVTSIPAHDTLAVGNSVIYFAKAADATNRILGDATEFSWASTNTAIATVDAATGLVKAVAVGSAGIIVSIDGKKDTVALVVEATRPGGSITGRILDAATDAPLAGVTLAGTGTPTVTDANGKYLLGGIQPGDSITVSKSGYTTIVLYDAPVFRNFTLQLPDAGLPAAGGTGTITGKVLNALSGGGASGITVRAYAGLNAAPSPRRPNAQPVATTTSGSGGVYTFSGLPAGAYTLLFSATGYSENITLASAVSGQVETAPDLILPPASVGAGLVAVLTWGPSLTNVPADLDAHVTGPDGGGSRFHVYTGNRAFVSSPDTIAALELDDQSYGGPEVVTIRASAAPGVYRFYVHNYSGRTVTTGKALSDSSAARVDLYQNNRVIGTFFPPANTAGTLWKVFEYDGARVIPVNLIDNPTDVSGATLPRIVGDEAAADYTRISAAIRALRKGQ